MSNLVGDESVSSQSMIIRESDTSFLSFPLFMILAL